jgi:hypothetical protein
MAFRTVVRRFPHARHLRGHFSTLVSCDEWPPIPPKDHYEWQESPAYCTAWHWQPQRYGSRTVNMSRHAALFTCGKMIRELLCIIRCFFNHEASRFFSMLPQSYSMTHPAASPTRSHLNFPHGLDLLVLAYRQNTRKSPAMTS